MSELRQNILTGDWVVVATERARRPESFSREPKVPVIEHLAGCPFCAGNESQTPPEVFALRPGGGPADAPGWEVRVVPNKYPAFRESADAKQEEPYRAMAAIGEHEVIIHGPDHDMTMAKMSVEHLAEVLSVYQLRLKDLAKRSPLVSAVIIVNQGREAGASIEHPHSQLFALPIVAPLVARELARFSEFQAEQGECPVCAMVRYERSHKERLVTEDEDFLAFCPYASRAPFEVCVVPKEHQRDFSDTDPARLRKAAATIKLVLERVHDRLGDPPYNLYLHTAPFSPDGDYHWRLTILPKISVIAGFEFATDIMINVVDPDAAAEFLR